MNIRFDDNNLDFNNLLVINGANKTGKSKLLKLLERGFAGEVEGFFVNNNRVYKGDFNTIFVGDYNNFSTDFKLTKSNKVFERDIIAISKKLKEQRIELHVIYNHNTKSWFLEDYDSFLETLKKLI